MPTPHQFLAPDTPFKHLLHAALSQPQVSAFASQAEAHRARFAFYNGLRQLKRAGDEWQETKDLLEAVVQQAPDGSWQLRIQPKSTYLMDILKQTGFVDAEEDRRKQFATRASEADAKLNQDSFDALAAQADVSAWLNEYFDGDTDEVRLAMSAWIQLDKPPLESFQALVQEKKPRA